MKVSTTIKTCSDDPAVKPVTIEVKSGWPSKHKVILVVDQKEYTVSADHLAKAIQNAVNVG